MDSCEVRQADGQVSCMNSPVGVVYEIPKCPTTSSEQTQDFQQGHPYLPKAK